MKSFLVGGCVLLLANVIVAPPPRHASNKEEHVSKEQEKEQEPNGLEGLGIEYERYLREVIDVLESDTEFKRKLEAAEETDIRSGKIAHELEYVDHNVRSKLDEVKRTELERLRHFAQREYELTNGIDVDHMKIMPPEHLDHDNPHTFEINDLKKLIHKVTNDLNEADKKRREEFKEYEMQKEFENQEKLKHLDGIEKETFEKQLKENETKHKQHDPLHHPGSKAQLEEVWEKQDHMKDQEFDPKVFFQLHDLDGNGYWDQNEVKALFVKELDKMYQAGAPEDDMRERAEELERMREHVFKEADKNGDQLLSFQEFVEQTKQPEFEKDPQWETVDQQPVYTHDEYAEFERRRQQEIQHMIQQGLIPPQPVYNVPPGYHPQMQQQQFHQAGHHQPQQQPQYQNQPANGPHYQQQHLQGQQHQQYPSQGQPQYQQQPLQGQPQYQQQPLQGQPHYQQYPSQGQPQYQQQHYQPAPGQLPPVQSGQFQQGHPGQPHQTNPNAHNSQPDPNSIPLAQAQYNSQPNAIPQPNAQGSQSQTIPNNNNLPNQGRGSNEVNQQAPPAPAPSNREQPKPQPVVNSPPANPSPPPVQQNKPEAIQKQPNPSKLSQEEPHQGFNVNIAAHQNQGYNSQHKNDEGPNSIGGAQRKY